MSKSTGGKVRSGEFPSAGRAHAVLEVDASAQLMTDINELLAFDAPFTWYTMSEEGPVLDWQHVRTIVDRDCCRFS